LPRIDRLLKSTSFRLAALQTLLFLAMFAVAAGGALIVLRKAEARAAAAEIEQSEDDLSHHLQTHGAATFDREWRRLIPYPGIEVRLEDAAGHVLAGRLPHVALPTPPPRKTWFDFDMDSPPAPGLRGDRFMATNHVEPGEMRLTVGENLMVRERQDNALLLAVAAIAAITAAIATGAGAFVAQRMLRRLDDMAGAVGAFAAGDRGARVPVSARARTDLDDLARALNQMMERENRLVEGLRQVSSAIAHDLRRPLAHHNQEITLALQRPASLESYRGALESASGRVADVLQTFQALLHIAELEAGAPGLELEAVDLNQVAARITQAYGPTAEAAGHTLEFIAAAVPVLIMAEQRAAGRMIANLVDNALIHTPEGTRVELRVEERGPRIIVSDNGPGVAEVSRSRIFERFFRLDASRSTPGSGLGLALAAATARAFDGRLYAEDAGPGLRVIADFAPTQGASIRRGEAA
jgi:signal transduction histidine kinase